MKLKLNTLGLSLLSLMILSACGPSKKDDSSSEFDKAKTLSEEIKDITYKIPKPSEIPYTLMQTGADYNQGLVNSRDGIDGYVAQPDKAALNLGVYAADMAYLSSYEKTQECIDYFNACKRLADELGIMGSFDPTMVQRVEGNIGNRDSLTSILDEAIAKTDYYLKTNSQSKLGALMVTGSFVESLYLATGVIKSYPKDAFKDPKQRINVLTPLMQIIVNQRASVAEVSHMLKNVDQTESITRIIKDMDELEASYAALNMDAQIKTGNATFTEETLVGLTKLIEKLRSDIVN